jgi:predicted nucleic acid-binding protein
VAANCLDLFQMMVPRAVEAEIRAWLMHRPQREYPYATLFRHLRGYLLDPPNLAGRGVAGFGDGEAEAISLARDLGALLLINERPGAAFAMSIGVPVVRVPATILALCSREVISERAARRRLDMIERVTSPPTIAEARAALTALSSGSAS